MEAIDVDTLLTHFDIFRLKFVNCSVWKICYIFLCILYLLVKVAEKYFSSVINSKNNYYRSEFH